MNGPTMILDILAARRWYHILDQLEAAQRVMVGRTLYESGKSRP
ncbi:MAG: hypothetical protein JWQ01_4865 [Massilia sp.]|nr:hypothetical protein [Massilia sp.]